MTYFFETYGCQMNSAESAALELVLAERGWTRAGSGETADLVLLNTCSVRETAETRVRGRIACYAALKKKAAPDLQSPRAFFLIVLGCMAERLGDKLTEEFPAVDYVLGTSARSLFPLILEGAEQGKRVRLSGGEKPVFSFSSSHLEKGAFRAFVPVMHGCDNFCSYCIVPFVRGREVSRSPESIIAEITLLAEKGVREITLLGQNVNSYQSGGTDFSRLLEQIAARLEDSPIEWARFLSANPGDLSPQTIRIMASRRCFCRHLHLPVQHGSNRILEAMNRRYTRESYLDLTERLKDAMPDISLSTDIMVGFPGETEDDLEAALDLMDKVRFSYAYMYHYNAREGTAAAKLPGRIPHAAKIERLGRVIALQKLHRLELLKARIGGREKVLIEGISRKNADEYIARTERDDMAVISGPGAAPGSFAEVRLCSLAGTTFRAVLEA